MSAPDHDKQAGNYLADLGRRGVFQAVGIYVAIAWGSIEILITASERFGWPDWLGNAALILFLTGLPLVVLLAWAFELTSSGFKRMEPGSLKGKALAAGAFTLTLGLGSAWLINGPVMPPAADASDGRPVIAVMPFQNFVQDKNSRMLTLSFADELINRINTHPDLVALNLSSVTSHAAIGPQARPLPADFYVQGAFRPAQVGTKLSARLVDGDGVIHWEFDAVRDLDDVRQAHAVQAYLAGEVASKLGATLSGRDYCEPSNHGEATRLYYQAKEQFEQRTPENVAGAALKLERAVQLDPGFARALDLLGSVYEQFPRWVGQDPSRYGMTESELRVFVDSRPHIPVLKRALDICPSLGNAYVSVALSTPVKHFAADLIDLIQEALRRDPGNTPLMDWAVYNYMNFGQLESAQRMAANYLLRDPLNARASSLMALTCRALGDSAKALELDKQTIRLSGAEQWAGMMLAYDRLVTGDHAALVEGIPEGFVPGPDSLWLDPRLLVDHTTNPASRQTLDEQLSTAMETIKTVNPQGFGNLIGADGGLPWAFELGDAQLAWSVLEDFAALAPQGATPYGFWFVRYRHWFGNQRLVDLTRQWTEEYIVFWNRHGPPDGCTWIDEVLACDWAG